MIQSICHFDDNSHQAILDLLKFGSFFNKDVPPMSGILGAKLSGLMAGNPLPVFGIALGSLGSKR